VAERTQALRRFETEALVDAGDLRCWHARKIVMRDALTIE
jgi:hypothetical protein